MRIRSNLLAFFPTAQVGWHHKVVGIDEVVVGLCGSGAAVRSRVGDSVRYHFGGRAHGSGLFRGTVGATGITSVFASVF